jgi:hypothetical protein
MFLSDDHPLNLGDCVAEEFRGGLIPGLARRPSGRALLDGLTKRRTTHALSCYSSTSVARTGTLNRPRFSPNTEPFSQTPDSRLWACTNRTLWLT